jgi:hypothetical protein
VDSESVKECHRFLDHLLLLRGHAPIDTWELFDKFSRRDVLYLNLWIRYGGGVCTRGGEDKER